jgi:DNA-binding beta-propeller fold protein YncE
MRRPILAFFVCWSGVFLGAQAGGPVTIDLPGGPGGIGFDDLRFAPSLNALLVPAGRTGALDLVDPRTGAVTAISGFSKTEKFRGGHGEGTTSADEGRGYLFATDRDSKEVAVVDPRSRRIVSRAKLSASPDYVRFVAPTGEVWVTEPDAERIEVFRLEERNPLQPVATGKIEVKGGPESLVIDGKRGRAYSHLWGGRTMAIDLKSKAIVATWSNGCKGSRGIALDEERGFPYVGCAEGKAVMLNAADGRQLSSATAGAGVDIIDYSPKAGRLYFPGGKSATMATFAVSAGGELSLLGTVPTAAGAHCVAADLSGNAYVCDPKEGRLLVFRDLYPVRGNR